MLKLLSLITFILLVVVAVIAAVTQMPTIIVPQDYYVLRKDAAVPWAGEEPLPLPGMPEEASAGETEIVAHELPNLELLATLVGSGKERRACIRHLESGHNRMYRRGEQVCSFQLLQIEPGSVLLENSDGIRITLETSSHKAHAVYAGSESLFVPVTDTTSRVKRTALFQKASDIIRSAGTVSVHAYARGEVRGLQVVTLPPGSVFAQSGLLPNDVIQAVNNQEVDTYQKALQVARKLPFQGQIEVKLIRNGKPLVLTFLMD